VLGPAGATSGELEAQQLRQMLLGIVAVQHAAADAQLAAFAVQKTFA
jgi:hypothetical protein